MDTTPSEFDSQLSGALERAVGTHGKPKDMAFNKNNLEVILARQLDAIDAYCLDDLLTFLQSNGLAQSSKEWRQLFDRAALRLKLPPNMYDEQHLNFSTTLRSLVSKPILFDRAARSGGTWNITPVIGRLASFSNSRVTAVEIMPGGRWLVTTSIEYENKGGEKRATRKHLRILDMVPMMDGSYPLQTVNPTAEGMIEGKNFNKAKFASTEETTVLRAIWSSNRKKYMVFLSNRDLSGSKGSLQIWEFGRQMETSTTATFQLNRIALKIVDMAFLDIRDIQVYDGRFSLWTSRSRSLALIWRYHKSQPHSSFALVGLDPFGPDHIVGLTTKNRTVNNQTKPEHLLLTTTAVEGGNLSLRVIPITAPWNPQNDPDPNFSSNLVTILMSETSSISTKLESEPLVKDAWTTGNDSSILLLGERGIVSANAESMTATYDIANVANSAILHVTKAADGRTGALIATCPLHDAQPIRLSTIFRAPGGIRSYTQMTLNEQRDDAEQDTGFFSRWAIGAAIGDIWKRDYCRLSPEGGYVIIVHPEGGLMMLNLTGREKLSSTEDTIPSST